VRDSGSSSNDQTGLNKLLWQLRHVCIVGMLALPLSVDRLSSQMTSGPTDKQQQTAWQSLGPDYSSCLQH
jgi:hypothetical protein